MFTALEGTSVVVVGASSGMGLATAIAARQAGANVAIVARDPGRLETARLAVGEGTRSFAFDAADSDAVEAMFAELGDGHGDARLKAHIGKLQADFRDTADIQYRARQLTEDVAVALQAKLGGELRRAPGQGNAGAAMAVIVDEALVAQRLGADDETRGAIGTQAGDRPDHPLW